MNLHYLLYQTIIKRIKAKLKIILVFVNNEHQMLILQYQHM